MSGRTPTLAELLRRGWRAPLRALLVGAAAALPVSGLLAIAFGSGNGMVPAVNVLVTGAIQLFLTFGIAGWLVLRADGSERETVAK